MHANERVTDDYNYSNRLRRWLPTTAPTLTRRLAERSGPARRAARPDPRLLAERTLAEAQLRRTSTKTPVIRRGCSTFSSRSLKPACRSRFPLSPTAARQSPGSRASVAGHSRRAKARNADRLRTGWRRAKAEAGRPAPAGYRARLLARPRDVGQRGNWCRQHRHGARRKVRMSSSVAASLTRRLQSARYGMGWVGPPTAGTESPLPLSPAALPEYCTQVTGGISLLPRGIKDVPDLANLGCPIAEISSDGNLVLTRPQRAAASSPSAPFANSCCTRCMTRAATSPPT